MEESLNISKITNSEYEDLISKSIDSKQNKEKTIVDGKVIAIENETVIVDVDRHYMQCMCAS